MFSKLERLLILIGSTIICVSMVIACNQGAQAPSAASLAGPALGQIAKSRVVQVVQYSQEGYGGGTGWMVQLSGHLYIVTNKHVCGDATSLLIRPESEFYFYRGHVIRISSKTDLCVIQPEAALPSPRGGYELAKNQAATADTLFVFGYGYLGPLYPVVGKFLGLVTVPPNPQDSLSGQKIGVINAEIFHGHSGSPVLNAEGKIVGVIFAIMGDPVFHNKVDSLFINLPELRTFLKDEEATK